MKYTIISNSDDTIDSRDIQERIDELEELRDSARDIRNELLVTAEDEDEKLALEADENDYNSEGEYTLTEHGFDEDERDELKVLEELASEVKDYTSEWKSWCNSYS